MIGCMQSRRKRSAIAKQHQHESDPVTGTKRRAGFSQLIAIIHKTVSLKKLQGPPLA
jgi:hypothetical protein